MLGRLVLGVDRCSVIPIDIARFSNSGILFKTKQIPISARTYNSHPKQPSQALRSQAVTSPQPLFWQPLFLPAWSKNRPTKNIASRHPSEPQSRPQRITHHEAQSQGLSYNLPYPYCLPHCGLLRQKLHIEDRLRAETGEAGGSIRSLRYGKFLHLTTYLDLHIGGTHIF